MIRRIWSEQVRLTFWAWLATVGASVMIAPLVAQQTYLGHGAVGTAALAVVGAALRARRVPWWAILVAQLTTLTEFAVVSYARGEALWGLIPTTAAFVELSGRVADFVTLTERYAAPVPESSDVTMTLALSIMALGLVVDAVAVSWRRVPLLGLVFLAIYMAPVSLLGGDVSLFVFIPGAAGFVFLLAADERERLTHWGRQISSAGSVWEDHAEPVNSQGIRSIGRRIGFGAVAAAVVLPVLIPTLSPHYFGESRSSEGGSGGDGRTEITNPVLDLRRNLVEPSDEILIRFRTDDPEPGYLRLASLNEFTESTWAPGVREVGAGVGSDSPLPSVPGLGSTIPRSAYRYDVEITENFVSTWLPLVYAPSRIEGDQLWRVDPLSLDASAIEEDQSTAGIHYSFDALLSEPSPAALRSGGRPAQELSAFTVLPDGLPSIIAVRAREVAGAEKNPFDQALALQAWFRSEGGFRYSVEAAPGTGIETIESFLDNNRVGYCEQFASAMALMARSLGIPSRVAVGFLRPESVGTNEFVYRGTAMHAWPELYFEGVGWVRFEPTPGVRTGSAPDFSGNLTDPNIGGGGRVTDEVPTSTPSRPADVVSTAPVDGASGTGPWSATGVALVVIGLGLLLAVAPRLARTAKTRRRWSSARGPVEAAEAAWAELRDTVVDLRLEWDAGATPRGMGRELRSRVSSDQRFVHALNRVVLATEQGRYAKQVKDSAELREAVRTVANALTATRSSWKRWLATWLPLSLLSSIGRWQTEPVDRSRGDELLMMAE